MSNLNQMKKDFAKHTDLVNRNRLNKDKEKRHKFNISSQLFQKLNRQKK